MKAMSLPFLLWVLFTSDVAAQDAQQPLTVTTENGVIKIEDTIRGDKEQPRVLSIVPWQPPRDKTALPSPFIQRIEQQFVPLERTEFVRKVSHFETSFPRQTSQ